MNGRGVDELLGGNTAVRRESGDGGARIDDVSAQREEQR